MQLVAGNKQVAEGVGQGQFAVGVQRPCIGLRKVFLLRYTPDFRCGGDAMHAPAPFLQAVLAHALLVGRETDRLDECAYRARIVGMRQQHSVHTRRQHLIEHPRVCANRSLVEAVHRHIHDDCRGAMATFRRPALYQALHVFRESLDIERRVFHVVADVIGERLRVFDALFEGAGRARMRPGVVNRLAIRQQLKRSVDVLRLVRLRD